MRVVRACAQVALYAAADIEAGEELYAHYGSTYAPLRDYEVGLPAVVLKNAIQRAGQLPKDWVEGRGLDVVNRVSFAYL